MPINRKMMNKMVAEYGKKKGKHVYFAVENIQKLRKRLSKKAKKHK